MNTLLIKNVSHHYQNNKPILSNIDLKINNGEFYSLIGRSGCGKTSLLNIASGLLIPQEGQVMINNAPLCGPIAEAGFVFQSPTLLEWKTVLQNTLFPIEIKRKSTQQEKERANYLLSLMKISELAHQYPLQLSGGQKSRVAIARALIKSPPFLFMDEPFAALDAITREELQQDLISLCATHNTTVIFITHDIAEAIYLSDNVAVIGQGKIIYNTHIPLAKPRLSQVRYSKEFNQLSHKLRQALEGGDSL
ncbi:ABC transporter ATP-binding protein [Oceanisphaera pacifica]|uniref:ABC transporter ATP-binding protein n=1 Tax=Oceanisphaera pacifica TaxID=2818389 RepID=A0ABS3NIL9_9GAMM|nr:ABC transporter ATP-binding protein [Oceanisphaera pacifica]MBO1520375.1 ABC transporter ATP-binding protein [Oceanisphaera pacifica]